VSAPPAQDRLARLLAIVPWVAAHDGPSITEVCERFGVRESELLADLDLLFLCGVHPFTPDTLIEVDVADGRVWIRFADYFRRPLRLTPPEGLALLGAGAALAGLSVLGDREARNTKAARRTEEPAEEAGPLSGAPGWGDPNGALGRALEKLSDVLGVRSGDALDMTLGAAPPVILEPLQLAATEHRKVEIDYYSFGRDGRSRRVIHPWRVHNTAGEWYVTAWCEQANGRRLFRVDRIGAATFLEATFEPPAEVVTPSAAQGTKDLYQPEPSAPLVVLDLASPAHWVAEQYPNEGVELRPDGRLRVRLRSSQRAWLERVLLRAGTDATIVEGDPQIRAQAATRILDRYIDPGRG